MEDDRTTVFYGKMPSFVRSLDEATGTFVRNLPTDTSASDNKVSRPVSDLRPDIRGGDIDSVILPRGKENKSGGQREEEEEEEEEERSGEGEKDAERSNNNNNSSAGRRASSAVEILRRNFGTISRKSPSLSLNNNNPVQYNADDQQSKENGNSEAVTQDRTECSDCEKDNRDTAEGAELKNERRFNHTRRLTTLDFHEVDIGTDFSGFNCKCDSDDENRTSNESVHVKERVYCTVYCIANDKYKKDAEITGHSEPPTHSMSDDAQEMEVEMDRDTGSSPEPYTLEDLINPRALNTLSGRGSGDGAVLLGCRVCLEDKPIAPLHCCRKAVCDECMKLYVSSQVRVGRADIMCPIPECHGFLEEGVVVSHLANEEVGKYRYFLELSQLDASTKPCPHCSLFTSLKTNNNQRSEYKYKVQCTKCQFVWCFKCHAPWHDGLRCREYRRGDRLLRHWASAIEHGQRNAQKCPRCKIHIQRTEGCDHMTCTQCSTNFCYRCGERYRHLRFFGDHTSNLSVFGCKYRYLPDRPHLRRLVRGSVCVSKVLVAPVVIVLVVVLGALSLVIGAEGNSELRAPDDGSDETTPTFHLDHIHMVLKTTPIDYEDAPPRRRTRPPDK